MDPDTTQEEILNNDSEEEVSFLGRDSCPEDIERPFGTSTPLPPPRKRGRPKDRSKMES
jgi:hypothetical protein